MKRYIAAFFALIVGVVALVPIQPAQAQVVSNRCCDGSGTIRCIMGASGPLGAPCVCYGQGTGYIC